MESELRIRVATPEDAPAVREIYAPAVREIYAPFCESTAVTFEETPPTETELADRIASTLEDHPWLVCERAGEVVGYAYAGPLRKRRAYQWVVELSVYVADSARRSGVGEALYESLFAVLERQGVRDAYAVTTLPNPATVGFHERLGFERLVDFPAMGYVEDEWHDVAWWRRSLGTKPTEPKPIRPFPSVREDDDCEELLAIGERRLEGEG